MSKGSSSCLKLIFGCCFGAIILLLVLVGFSVFMVKSNQMEPPVFEELSRIRRFDSHELQGVVLSDLPPDVIPIKLQVQVELCNLTILPDGPSGAINVTGEYDTANGVFDFSSDNDESNQSFRLSYRSRKSLLFNIVNEDAERVLKRNNIIIHLPTDSAIDLKVIHKQGNLDMDLSGIPLHFLSINSKMSELNVRNITKNPLVMSEMIVEHSMGETLIKNLQNYRFDRMNVDFSMGEFNLKSNGLFHRSATIQMDASLGNLNIVFPENVKIVNHVDSDSGNLFLTEHEHDEKNVEVILEGRIKWGDASVSQ